MTLDLYKPEYEELWFRRLMLEDEATMSYNHAWGGAIPFPETEWREWYEHWVAQPEGRRFYRYLKAGGDLVGEIAWHCDAERDIYAADVIVYAPFRGKGFGGEGLDLLCRAAAESGIAVLRDDIAIDNPAIGMFLRRGFVEEYRTHEIIMLKKDLKPCD